MAVNTKAIKRRIKSVGSTRKITKAMEMVSAAKMRNAVRAALNTRTYAQMAWDLLVNLSHEKEVKNPLLDVRPVKKLLLILVTSSRGFCGAFNSNIIKKTAEQLKDPRNISRHRLAGKVVEPADQVSVDVISIGKKGSDFCKKMNYNLIASYNDFSETPALKDVTDIIKMINADYEAKKYDKVVIAYTDFKSAINQIPKLRQVLPISEVDLEKMISDLDEAEKSTDVKPEVNLEGYLFEPNKEEVLSIILPRLVETQVYQALLESSASEFSARMVAMRNASDAATDMIKNLNLNYNKARQAGITQEIAEIAGGAAALE